MDNLQQKILSAIKQHGIDNPIVSKTLEGMFSATGPQIRGVIHSLRMQGVPIGSSGGRTPGYFYAGDEEEYVPTMKNIASRAHSLLALLWKMKRTFKVEEKDPQLKIFN